MTANNLFWKLGAKKFYSSVVYVNNDTVTGYANSVRHTLDEQSESVVTFRIGTGILEIEDPFP